MNNSTFLNKITDNTKFIKELDFLLKDSAKAYRPPKKDRFFDSSFMVNLIDIINSQLEKHPFFKNFKFSENPEFDLYGHLLITSDLPSKIYQENLESITVKIDNLDSIINNSYLVSEISIKKKFNNEIGEYTTYSINQPNITSLNWISLETFNGSFSMHLSDNGYGFSRESISDYNATGELVDFVNFIGQELHEKTEEIATILNKAFFEGEFLSQEKIEYYSLTQDIDLSVINKMSHLFINLDNFKLDNVYHNANQNKKTIKHSK